MSSLTLQNTINWTLPFIEYSPVTGGLGLEPAISTASMIRNSLLNAPQSWFWNRNSTTFVTTISDQDYTETIADFAFLEKASLTDDQGNIYEIKDVYNNQALSKSSAQQRPSAIAVQSIPGTNQYVFRFIGVPDQIYTVTLEYQMLSPQFGPFVITSVANAVGSDTAYTGVFDPISFPVGAIATIGGCTTSANNGSFVVVTCTSTTLTVANSSGVAESESGAYVNNLSWAPIPDQYSDIYNNLFLAEMLALVDDARSQVYRQRGIGAFLAKSAGLTETQKNAFVQQWLARDVERQNVLARAQQGQAGRGI